MRSISVGIPGHKQRYSMDVQVEICFSIFGSFGDCLNSLHTAYLFDYFGDSIRNETFPLSSSDHSASDLRRLHLASVDQWRLDRLDTPFLEQHEGEWVVGKDHIIFWHQHIHLPGPLRMHLDIRYWYYQYPAKLNFFGWKRFFNHPDAFTCSERIPRFVTLLRTANYYHQLIDRFKRKLDCRQMTFVEGLKASNKKPGGQWGMLQASTILNIFKQSHNRYGV